MTDLPALPKFSTRVLPVVVLANPDHAVPLARALLAGGIDAIEITLRHPTALESIRRVAREVPDMVVGAGTVLSAFDVANVRGAGGRFALSPGATPALLAADRAAGLPFVPGVMTPSEAMAAREAGYRLLKLFPASQAGGLGMLQALASPLPDISFCPTGGVSADNLASFLAQPNVALAGGSWLTPARLVTAGDWEGISELARQACAIANGTSGGAA